MMRVLGLLCVAFFVGVGVGRGAEPPARTVLLKATDALKYDVTTIAAKPGERIHIVLKTISALPKVAMSHNFVILKPGTDQTAFLNACTGAGDHDYLAPEFAGKLLVSTKMAAGGETVEATFTAPTAPGSYPYLCTFPGHMLAGMKGMLVVK